MGVIRFLLLLLLIGFIIRFLRFLFFLYATRSNVYKKSKTYKSGETYIHHVPENKTSKKDKKPAEDDYVSFEDISN